MNLVYIHGANASPDSFNFIRMKLGGNDLVLKYDSANGFHHNLKSMRTQLDGIEDIFFIAHSLGGIYAAHLAQHLPGQVQGAVTLATPYGGSKAAEWIKWLLPFNQLLQDIQPHSAAILQAHSIRLQQSWTNIVTTKGHSSLMMTANDGVVTAASMRYRSDMTFVDVSANHYEVLLSHHAVAVIRAALERAVQNIHSGSPVCI